MAQLRWLWLMVALTWHSMCREASQDLVGHFGDDMFSAETDSEYFIFDDTMSQFVSVYLLMG